jgi:hypothetical protein
VYSGPHLTHIIGTSVVSPAPTLAFNRRAPGEQLCQISIFIISLRVNAMISLQLAARETTWDRV